MRKAVAKRIKITKNKKMFCRTSGQNHFNAKESRQTQNRYKKMSRLSDAMEKKVKAYLQ